MQYLYLGLLFLTTSIMGQEGYYEGQIQHQNKTWNIAIEFTKESIGQTIAYSDFLEISAFRRQFEVSKGNNKILHIIKQLPPRVDLKFEGLPVYLAWGDADDVVPYLKKELITNSLASMGNNNVTVKIWPNVDHSIYVVNRSSKWDFSRECKGYFTEMADWILKNFND